jgi:hypothetical protein
MECKSQTIQSTGGLTNHYKIHSMAVTQPPLWSSGQSFWLQTQRSRVRLVLPDFLRSSESGT